jgi:hypothetical protein
VDALDDETTFDGTGLKVVDGEVKVSSPWGNDDCSASERKDDYGD